MDKKIVLVVDDTPENIDLLKALLKDNYKIKAAVSGEKAIKISLKTPCPDVILLDVMMPIMDGYETCQILKDNPTTKHIPIIFISGNDAVEDQTKAMNMGAVDYIKKPVDSNYLINAIEKILEA